MSLADEVTVPDGNNTLIECHAKRRRIALNNVKVQVLRSSQIIREYLYLDLLPETFLSVALPNGTARFFKTPVEVGGTVIYGMDDYNVVISSVSTRRLFLVNILNEKGERLAEGNFKLLPDAESWAMRTLAEQRLFNPKDTLQAEIIPLSEKEAEAFLSASEEEEEVPDEV